VKKHRTIFKKSPENRFLFQNQPKTGDNKEKFIPAIGLKPNKKGQLDNVI
jgi:hypothetical protein